MTLARLAVAGLVVLVLAASFSPLVGANHCYSKLAIYSRTALAPTTAPPHTSFSASTCGRLFGQGVADEHMLMPGADQVTVRVNGDLGSSVPRLTVTLTGLGFDGDAFVIERTPNPFGGYVYQASQWVNIPNPGQQGELTATVRYPGNVDYSVTYHTLPPPVV